MPDLRAFLEGGGEMGALLRAHDWSATAVGPIHDWPQSLRSALSICLRSPKTGRDAGPTARNGCCTTPATCSGAKSAAAPRNGPSGGARIATTNAPKYGALSIPEGRITVAWQVEESTLRLEWRESGGSPVAERRGFGLRMIERALAADLGGRVEMNFEPHGLVCRIERPLGEAAVEGSSE